MRVVVTQKISSSNIPYGQLVGGKTGDSTPGNIETSFFENVSSVVETTSSGIPVYEITHMSGDTAEPHTARYSIANYIISVIGG